MRSSLKVSTHRFVPVVRICAPSSAMVIVFFHAPLGAYTVSSKRTNSSRLIVPWYPSSFDQSGSVASALSRAGATCPCAEGAHTMAATQARAAPDCLKVILTSRSSYHPARMPPLFPQRNQSPARHLTSDPLKCRPHVET